MAPELHELTATQASAMVRRGDLAPSELVSELLGRIEQIDPSLGAWTLVDREGAVAAAAAVEARLREGRAGLLCGVPVGLKDIFYTAGLTTAANSPLYADFVPEFDATCVARLKNEGAIVLGKTVTAQFAAGDPTDVRNPWNHDANPGGSSTGSAVAVAARMCPAALGSQTGGSTLRPASYNGIVGFKPSFGRISKRGVVPNAWSFDTVGILVRTVEDAALMLEAMAGHDELDPTSARRPVGDYVESVKTADRPPRIGVIREYFLDECDEETRRLTEDVTESLARQGAAIEELSLPGLFREAEVIGPLAAGPELAAFHERLFRDNPSAYGPRIRSSIEAGMLVPAVSYLQAQRLRRSLRNEMQATVQRFDAVLTPATPTPPQMDLSTTGDPKFQTVWTQLGLPAISLPAGLSGDGLPMGIQLVSAAFDECSLLATAAWCERVIQFDQAPVIGVGLG